MANTELHRTVIAPFLLGQFFCEESLCNPDILDDSKAAYFSANLNKTGASRISQFLDRIGPKVSPSGRFSLGYTLNLPLMRYFRKVDGAWIFDGDVLRTNIRTIAEVDRDVVVYLSANHFTDANEELLRELATDPANLMWGRDGPLPPDDYFSHMIVSWTLSDYSAPITRMREQALRAAALYLTELPEYARARIISVSILGEVHDMFPNFVQGPSQTLPMIQTTDYSPMAQRGFQTWLAQKFDTIAALNAQLGATYDDFQAVIPPSRDMLSESCESLFHHVDRYAAGSCSVYGWAHDRLSRPIAIDVYVDGILQGEADMGLSRTDVVDGNDLMSDPNVGFRFDIDYRNLSKGIHLVDAVLRVRGAAPLHMARSRIVIKQAPTEPMDHIVPAVDIAALYDPISFDPNLTSYLDGPHDGQALIFNPLAPLWLEYRNKVVRNYFEHFSAIAMEQGIEPDKVYSHQMAPNLYGSWTSDLIALDGMQRNPARYNHGVTLYGGTAFGPAIERMAHRLGWDRYGVNELNPIVTLSPDGYQAMFEHHHRNGATFLSPYYMAIYEDETSTNSLNQYLIAPKNFDAGTGQFWDAIVAIMKR